MITGAASGVLGIGEGLAATVQAIAVGLPQYDAQLFTSQLRAGHLLNAIGMPIAADLALAPYALIYGAAFPVITAAATTVTQLAELAGLEPNPATTAASSNTRAVTPKVAPVAAQVTPATPKVSPVAPHVSPVAAQVSPATPKVTPVTAQVTTVIPHMSPVTPKITTTTMTTSPSGTQTNGPTLGTGNKPTPAANATTPPAGSHHGKRS